jgi:hypothetical protein
MKARVFVFLVLLAALGCEAHRPSLRSTACRIEGPKRLAPDELQRIHLGMSKTELEGVLGQADYSPLDGQFYFGTGGECPLDGTGREAPCGVVADFNRTTYGATTIETVVTDSLQSCWWGAIGE